MAKTKIVGNSKKLVDKIGRWVSTNRKEAVLLGLILLVGAVLRLYKIADFMTFLGDEGRDAIIVRRLLVDFDPILIGPVTSIGNMYLGPLYYYFMAPGLLLSNFSPVGPAIQIAMLGVVTVWFVWFLAREWFGVVAGLLAAGLYAISPSPIIFSRSSWNPNIMPFFALLCVYAIWRVWSSTAKATDGQRNYKWLVVLGISLAFVLQSHYLGLLLVPTLGLFWLLSLKVLKNKQQDKKQFVKHSVVGGIIFLFLMSPLPLFDYRHGWINFSAMKKFFTERQTTVSARPWNALPEAWPEWVQTNVSLIGAKNETLGLIFSFILIAGLMYMLIKAKNKAPFWFLFVWLGAAIGGLALYKQHIYDHYYGFFFAAPYLLFGSISQHLLDNWKTLGKVIISALIIAAIWTSFVNLPIKGAGVKQVERARVVADKIRIESQGERFNIAVVAERNYEDGYQYFLEKERAPVVDIDAQRADETITDQLFVVCEMPKEKCDPTNSPKAEVANFGWTKVESEWEVAGVTIYKLVHNYEEAEL